MTYCIVNPESKPRHFYEEAALEYEKRLSRFCATRRLRNISKSGDRDFTILISPDGNQLSSEEMARRLKNAESTGSFSRVIFSLNPGLNLNYNEEWALVSINLPSDLLTVLLLEQIYRAQKIIHNEPYHK